MNPQIEIFYLLLLQQVVDLVVFIYDGSFLCHCCQNLRSATVLTFSMILSMVSKGSFNPRSFS